MLTPEDLLGRSVVSLVANVMTSLGFDMVEVSGSLVDALCYDMLAMNALHRIPQLCTLQTNSNLPQCLVFFLVNRFEFLVVKLEDL